MEKSNSSRRRQAIVRFPAVLFVVLRIPATWRFRRPAIAAGSGSCCAFRLRSPPMWVPVLIGAAFRRPYRPVDSGRQPQCRRFGVGGVGDPLENRLVRLPEGRFRAGRRRCSKDEGRRVGTLPVIYNLRCGLPCDAPCGTGIPVERSEVRKRRTSDRLFFLFYTVR